MPTMSRMTTQRRQWATGVCWCLSAMAALLATPAYAQPSFYESEPNNSPAEANEVAGAVTILGDLGGRDQDAFLWAVSDVDAQKRWTFELLGIPGTPTIAEVYRLEFADNGVDVLAKHKLFRIGTRENAKPGLIEDLLFEPGDYLVGIASAGGAAGGYRLHTRYGSKLNLAQSPPKIATRESARKLKTASEYSALIETPESWFQFTLNEEEAEQLWVARVQLPLGQKAQIRVHDNDGKLLVQNSLGSESRGPSKELDLAPGTYFVEIASETVDSIRAIVVEPIGPRREAEKAETDTPAAAPSKPQGTTGHKGSWKTPIRVDLGQPATGRFGEAHEYYYFSFDLHEKTTEQVLALRAEVENNRQVNLCLLDAKGEKLQCRRSEGTAELPDLVLTPGTWGVMVEGKAGDPAAFAISLASTGSVEAGIEAEPNDKIAQSTGIPANIQIQGRFAGPDEDFYRLVVTGEAQLWRFEAEGDGIRELRYHDGAGVQSHRTRLKGGGGRASLESLFLMPGQHYVSLKGDNGGPYTLSAHPLGPPDPDGEYEPNDNPAKAEVLRFGQDRTGLLANPDDNDFYRFSLANDEHLRLTLVPPADGSLTARIQYGTSEVGTYKTHSPEPAVLQGLFAPGDYQVRMYAGKTSESKYHLRLEILSRFSCTTDCEPVHTRKLDFTDAAKPTSGRNDLPIDLILTPEAEVVAAYSPFGQTVPAELRLVNNGPQSTHLKLETATTDHRWSAVPELTAIELAAGASRTVPLEIRVPRDAWADPPVLISVRAFEDSGAQTETSTEIRVDGRAVAINPSRWWSVPDSMLGGVNAAWDSLGGRRVPAPNESKNGEIPGVGKNFDELFDGRVREATATIIRAGRKIEEIPVTVDLAGDQPLEVVGIVLNPVGTESAFYYLAEFELQLSLDGESFETVLRDRLRSLAIDQSFALAEPTPARFARLLLLSSQEGSKTGKIGLGEWKVIARPGSDLSGGTGFNLASPGLGGHVVWSEPPISGGHWERNVLSEAVENYGVRLDPGQSLEWAVSFQNQRAARIARFEWVDTDRAKPEERLGKVTLAVALDSPIGPWTKIGEWDRSVSPDEFRLETSVWARYVRFTFPGSERKARFYPPETLRIFEQPADVSYFSILGEWEQISPQAAYEHSLDVEIDSSLHNASGNNSRQTAAALAIDQRVSGRVTLGEEDDWYKVSVPAGLNTLQITMSGMPSVRTALHAEDSAGAELPLTRVKSNPGALIFKAIVEPGQTYWFRVQEPPRSVVFAFDTSGSVRAFETAIYRAVNAYAGDLVPGRDVANILPFGAGLLTKDWIGEPYVQRIVLNDFPRQYESSAAEEHLDKASRALASQPGAKAIVVITDAETSRFPEMWDSFEVVRPRIFTMRVGNADKSGLFEDLMQSWAMVNNGYYDYTKNQGEMDRAFDRAATFLRQPAAYGLEVSAIFEEAPGPGSLHVISGDDGSLGGAVALILDASGSMLKRMEGGRRIEIAKDLLSKAVTEHIPPGTPVALRVFGHKEANSCRTDLVIPMTPLDPAAVDKTLAGINAKNLAKTPIADSLAKIESDLEGVTGKRVVVLVTDGEETCEGDPSAVLAKLSERGIDLRLEIVGFAIANDELKQQFEGWAGLGGGRYFDAGDAASLESSLAEALQIPYSVFDQNGSLVANGTVDGEPLTLEAGYYRVSIATSPPETIDEVHVPGEEQVELKAGGSSN